MKISLIELVDVIMRRIEESPDTSVSEPGLRLWLKRQGYAKRDIDAAIKLVGRKYAERSMPSEIPQPQDERQRAVRVLSVHEEYKLSPEARHALARLELYGLIEPYEREMILDYLNHFEGEVGLEELDYLLSWMVCSGRDVEFQQTLYGVFEGKESTRH